MNNLPAPKNRRVLVIDDHRAIHDDFRKILCPDNATAAALDAAGTALFGNPPESLPQTPFEIDSAYQGQEGVLLAAKALEAGRPYALAFVDVRMPPGWDGVETTGKLWELDPNLQVVLCTAYSDYSWKELFEKLGQRDGLLILKKPFDAVEAFQLAHALTEKWWLHQQSRQKMEELESMVAERTQELARSLSLLTATLESTPDGVVAVDLSGKVVSYNARFAGCWQFPTEMLARGDAAEMRAHTAAQVKDSAKFLQQIKAVEANPGGEGLDVIELKDGRTFERYVFPQRIDHECVGTVINWRDITERSRAEAALQQSKRFLRSTLDALTSHIAILDEHGTIIEVNAAWNHFASKNEFRGSHRGLGDDYLQLCDAASGQFSDEAPTVASGIRAVIAGHIDEFHLEYPCHSPGEQRWFIVRATRFGGDGPVRVVVAHENITERKQAENALRESNEKFQQLATNVADVFYMSSPDMQQMHYASPAYEQIWGRSVESLYANPLQWGEAILPEERARVFDVFSQLAAEAPNVSAEFRIARPDGTTRWILSRGFQVRDAAGKVIRITGIASDITERKRNEIAILAFSKLGQSLSSVASAREAFDVIKGISKELFGWDAFTIRLYNAPADSFYAGIVIDTIAGQEVAAEQNEPVKPGELYRRIMTRGGELILRTEQAFGSGITPFGDVSRPSAVLMFVPIRSRGHAVGALSVQSYVPNAYTEPDLQTLQTMADQCGGAIERIWADEAIRQTEARLVESQKLETVGKLAGGVAHEFNSILTAISGQSELLLADLPPESPLIGNAAEISKAAGRAAALTRQLLAYGRKQFLQPEILDLNAVLAGMESTLRHLMGRAVDVRLALATGLHPVKADRGQMEQVILNLVMNAAEAMPQGGKLTLETADVSLDAQRHPEMKPGAYVMLAITDTGAGMSEAVKARAFEPFFTTKGVGQGTGLGLSTCYGIIKQSGGHISVYSEPGRGTTFKIYLPQIEPQAQLHLERLDSPDLPRGSETVLLVEDDPALREMAATLLSRLGYTILSAANGIEALSLQSERSTGPIDLLFTDVVMPHLSGKELADRVRALSPRTRILFTSAYAEKAIVHQGVLDHGGALLQKPFSPSALAHKLREVLDQPAVPT